MPSQRPRILIAVEPRVLGDALGGLLEQADLDDIVVVTPGGAPPRGRFDAAVVSGPLAPGVTADLVIRLPDVYGNGGPGRLVDGGHEEPVHLDGVRDVIDLLDHRCASDRQRADRLRLPEG